MPGLEYVVATALLVALVVYVLTGGADFGGGIWYLLSKGPRKQRQRQALSHAIAPIWEANHVWMIVAVVLLFVCFPRAFAAIMTALHIPVTLMLIGIVLRGSAFAFQSYSAGATGLQKRSERVFAAASTFTPFMLGVSAGAVASSEIPVRPGGAVDTDFISEWLAPFPFAIGAFTLALCAYLAAVYMTVETESDEPLAEDFRLRALWTAVACGASALLAAVLAATQAPLIWEDLFASPWAVPFHAVTAAAAIGGIALLWRRRYRLARAAAIVQVALIVTGWGLAQYPYLVYPDLTIDSAAAEAAVLRPVLIGLAAGAVLLIPSFYYLFAVFKRQNDQDPGAAGLSPPESTD